MIGAVGDDDVVVRIDAEMFRPVKGRLPGVAAVAGVACLAADTDRRANLALRIDDPQRMAAALQDVDVSLAIEAGGPRIDEGRRFRIRAIHGNSLLPVAGDEMHRARVEVDGPNAAVVEIRDQQFAALEIEGDAIDAAELGLGGGAL